MKTVAAANGSPSSHDQGADHATGDAVPPAELLRGDLRELGPYPGDAAACLRYRPGTAVRAAVTAALTRAAEELGARVGSEPHADAKLRRREALSAALARSTGVASAEIAPFASLATLFSVLCSAFPRSRDRQPASAMLAAPGRHLYKWSARAAGVKVVEVPLDAELRPDLAVMTRALGALRPSLIILGSPHDGTGIAPEPAALEKLLRATVNDALVVLDESFAPPGWSRRSLRRQLDAPHLVLVRSLEPWVGVDAGCSWLELAPELARALEAFPPVARPELTAAQVAMGEALLTGTASARFAAEAEELHAVHDRLRARLAEVPGARPLAARAPFVGVVCDEPVDRILEEAARRGMTGVTGGGVGRLARLARIAVADDAEADRVVRLFAEVSA